MKHTHRTAVVLVLIMGIALGAALAASAYDLHTANPDVPEKNALFEDGSFIVSIGAVKLAGCKPFKPCALD